MTGARGSANRRTLVLCAFCLSVLLVLPMTSRATKLPKLSDGGTGSQEPCGALAFDFVSNATLVSLGDWSALNVTIYDSCAGNIDVVMFALWKAPSSGQTVSVGTAGAAIAASHFTSFYVPVFNVPPGTYAVYLFGVAVLYDYPVSFVLETPITI